MPVLALPPRFWVVLAVAFTVVLVGRMARRRWADIRHAWHEGRHGSSPDD